MSEAFLFGKETEQEAAHWLEARGYQILVRNFRIRRGEIDLIAEFTGCQPLKNAKKTRLVFVEVKSVQSEDQELAFWSIQKLHSLKRNRMRRVAEAFLLQYKGAATTCQFDFLLRIGKNRWMHWPDVF